MYRKVQRCFTFHAQTIIIIVTDNPSLRKSASKKSISKQKHNRRSAIDNSYSASESSSHHRGGILGMVGGRFHTQLIYGYGFLYAHPWKFHTHGKFHILTLPHLPYVLRVANIKVANVKPLLTALAECFLKDLYSAISFYVIIKNETFYYYFFLFIIFNKMCFHTVKIF